MMLLKAWNSKILKTLKRSDGLGKPAEPATINRELACLRSIFKRALTDQKIASNPLVGFKMLLEDNVRNRVLSDEEYHRLLEHAPKHIVPIIETAWETGMRAGEILSLKWEQVDSTNGVIRLSGEKTKTGRSRVVPISPRLDEVLTGLPRINEYLFTFKGQRLRDFRTAFQKAKNGAGLRGLWFHDLRHCFVTRMRRKGVADRVIMAITGHQTFECFRRYDTIDLTDLAKAVG